MKSLVLKLSKHNEKTINKHAEIIDSLRSSWYAVRSKITDIVSHILQYIYANKSEENANSPNVNDDDVGDVIQIGTYEVRWAAGHARTGIEIQQYSYFWISFTKWNEERKQNMIAMRTYRSSVHCQWSTWATSYTPWDHTFCMACLRYDIQP